MTKATTLFSLLIAVCAVSSLTIPAHADLILAYTPNNGDSTEPPSIEGAGVSGWDMSRGSTVYHADGSGFTSKGFTGNTLTVARTQNDYVKFGFESTVPYDLGSLDIQYSRSSVGPNQLAIDIFIDGGSGYYPLVYHDTSVSVTSGEENSIDLSQFTGITDIEFRIYAWTASSSEGTLSIMPSSTFYGGNGVVINGAVVPEPSSFVFIGLAFGISLLVWRWRR